MRQGSEQTKQLLAESLKREMEKKPFEKITITEITDQVGVIRPTFYKYFSDKDALIEWIFQKEILMPTITLLENDMLEEAACLMLTKMKKEDTFYMAAFQSGKQNFFEKIVKDCIQELFLEMLQRKMQGIQMSNPLATPERLAKFYANVTTFFIIQWLEEDMASSPKEVAQLYVILVSKTIDTILRRLKDK